MVVFAIILLFLQRPTDSNSLRTAVWSWSVGTAACFCCCCCMILISAVLALCCISLLAFASICDKCTLIINVYFCLDLCFWFWLWFSIFLCRICQFFQLAPHCAIGLLQTRHFKCKLIVAGNSAVPKSVQWHLVALQSSCLIAIWQSWFVVVVIFSKLHLIAGFHYFLRLCKLPIVVKILPFTLLSLLDALNECGLVSQSFQRA